MIRLAKTEDLNNITDVYSYARKFMAENGNPTQWGTNYPSEQLIENDINNKKMYVIEEENQIHAVFMFDICEDATYEVIKNGQWLSDEEYGVIHRVASDGKIKGVLNKAVDFCSAKRTHQDMRDFALPYTVDAMVSIGDSMNYITTADDLKSVFECVYNGLEEGGVFIFDLKTIHFFRDILSDNTYAQNRDDSAFIWDNCYEEKTRNNIYNLAVFVLNEDGAFDRYEENHCQHGFTMEEVLSSAEAAGLTCTATYDAFSHDAPKDDSERLYFVFKR